MRRIESVEKPFAEFSSPALFAVIAKSEQRNNQQQSKMHRLERIWNTEQQRILKSLEIENKRKRNKRIKRPFQNLLIPEFPKHKAYQHTPVSPVAARWKPADRCGDNRLEYSGNLQFIPRNYVDEREQKVKKEICSVNHKRIAARKWNTHCRRPHFTAHDFNRQPSAGLKTAKRKNR